MTSTTTTTTPKTTEKKTTQGNPNKSTGMINGINVDALRETMETVTQDPAKAQTNWRVATTWMGGTRSDTRVTSSVIGGETIEKDWTIHIDEPLQLCGTNQYANPQEYLMAATNACMMVGYVAGAALMGIELEDVQIETTGDIDLRGFLGIDRTVKAGYDSLHYKVTIKGNGTPEEYKKLHAMVAATSPNHFNMANAIQMNSELVVK